MQKHLRRRSGVLEDAAEQFRREGSEEKGRRPCKTQVVLVTGDMGRGDDLFLTTPCSSGTLDVELPDSDLFLYCISGIDASPPRRYILARCARKRGFRLARGGCVSSALSLALGDGLDRAFRVAASWKDFR